MNTPSESGWRPSGSAVDVVLASSVVTASRRARAFVVLVQSYFANHPEMPHEWRLIPSRVWGDRIDLVCRAGAPTEVFATLRSHQIVVGLTNGDHDDFEDFGRGLSEDTIAREAFERFVEILEEFRGG